uniref:Uncharacterized protein n=1 Tax=Cacopsylla melanoneura TaxID=428564 RepID=A0A8D9E752_9HEMI
MRSNEGCVYYETEQRVATRNSLKLRKMMLGSNTSNQYSELVDRLCNNFIQQGSYSGQIRSNYRNDGNSYSSPSFNNGGNSQQSYYQNYVSSFDNLNYANNQSYCQQTSSWTNGHYTGFSSQSFGNTGDESYNEDRRVFLSEPPQRGGGYMRTVEYSSSRSEPPYRGDGERKTKWRRNSGDCRMDLEEQTINFIRNNKRVISSREEREYSHDIRYNEKHIKKLVKKVIKKQVREEIPKSKRGEAEKPGRYSITAEEKGSSHSSKNNKSNDLDKNRIDKSERSLRKVDSCKTNEKPTANENSLVKSDGSKTSQTSIVINSSVQKKNNDTSSNKEIVPGSYFKSTCEKEDISKVGQYFRKTSDSNISTTASYDNEALDKINDSDNVNKSSSSESLQKTNNNEDSAEKVTPCEQTGMDKTKNTHLLDNSNNESINRDKKIESSITDNLLNLPPNGFHSSTMEIEENELQSLKRENDIQADTIADRENSNTDKENDENDCMIVDSEDMTESIGNDSITENESFVVIDEITEADDGELKRVTEDETSPEIERNGETNEKMETNQDPLLDLTINTTETIVQDVISTMVDTICNTFNNTPSEETNSVEKCAVADAVNPTQDTICDKSTPDSDTIVAELAKTSCAKRNENINSTTSKESHNSESASKVVPEHSRSLSKERNPIGDDSTFNKHHKTKLDHAEKFADTLDDENNNKKIIHEHRSPGKSKKHKKKPLVEARSTYRVRKNFNIAENQTLDKELGTDEFMERYNHHKRLQSPYLNTNQEYDFYGQHCSRSSSRQSLSYQKYSYRNTTSYSQYRNYGNDTYQTKVERRHFNRTECKRQDYERYDGKRELCPKNIDPEYMHSTPAKRNKLAENSVDTVSRNAKADMNSSHELLSSGQNCLLSRSTLDFSMELQIFLNDIFEIYGTDFFYLQ